MSLVTTKTEPAELTKETPDDVIRVCEKCSQHFLAKYWDSELDWYIELNDTPFCRQCQPHNE